MRESIDWSVGDQVKKHCEECGSTTYHIRTLKNTCLCMKCGDQDEIAFVLRAVDARKKADPASPGTPCIDLMLEPA